jgi:hypothetical protein
VPLSDPLKVFGVFAGSDEDGQKAAPGPDDFGILERKFQKFSVLRFVRMPDRFSAYFPGDGHSCQQKPEKYFIFYSDHKFGHEVLTINNRFILH